DDGLHSKPFPGTVHQQIAKPPGLGDSLLDRIAVVRLPIGPDRFTVVGNVRLATRRLAPRFRFNDEESLRAEHDVVEVELLPDDVVKHAGPSVAYLFQILSDGPLAIAAKLQAL